jgi:CBS domain containing-hemolysin-like protein
MFTDLPLMMMLAALPLLAAASGFFSGSETALFSLSAIERRRLADERSIAANALNALLADTRTLLITLLLSNMIVNVLYFVISTVVFIRLNARHGVDTWVVAILTPLPLLALIFMGEVLPKTIADRMARRWSGWIAVPLLMVHRAIAPARLVINVAIITPLARLIAPRRRPPRLHRDELAELLTLSREQSVIDLDEEGMLKQVLRLGRTKASDLMTPRVKMVAFEISRPPEQLIALMRDTHRHHIPVYRGDVDHIEGLVEAKQVATRPPTTHEQLRRLIRPVHFVPESQTADRLLITLRKGGATTAIVVDEYGGTAGVVSLEDVVEHMVGAITDPHEAKGPQP